ncbi:MAG: DUF2279 domain-containing protein [Flavisolibacter sp.]
MRYTSFLVSCLIISHTIYGQDSSFQKQNNYPQDQGAVNRQRLILTLNVVAYGTTTALLYETWYKNYPHSPFHFFNDNKEWLQVDKAGHTWSAYQEGRLGIAEFSWAGMERNKAIWIGGLSGLAYQSIIEILDGFSAEWGFSWGDYVANISGSALLIAQELGWKEQRFQLKFSSHRNTYETNELNERADELYGKNLPERILKDYNAQTYWLSTNLRSFIKETAIPPCLNIAVGYGADGMFGAVKNTWMDSHGNWHDRTDIKRYRQFYLAPDIDLTKIKSHSRLLKSTFFILNSFKFPLPSLELSNGSIKGHWFHF